MASDPAGDSGWSVRVTATGKDAARAFVRKQQFTVGLPVQFDEAAPNVSSLEYVLGAIGAELVNGTLGLARKRRLAIDHAEAIVKGTLNDPLAYLGVVGAQGHAGLERISAKVFVSTVEDEAAIRRLWDDVLERSPLLCTLRPVIRFDLSLKVSF